MDCNFAVVGCESAAADGWAPFLFARYGVDANWTQAAAYPECQLPNFFGIWPTYVATVDCATLNPSLSSSPWMRGAPQGKILYAHPPDQRT
jgi:hypothetical protein